MNTEDDTEHREACDQIVARIETELAEPIGRAARDVVERLGTDGEAHVDFSPGDNSRYRCHAGLTEMAFILKSGEEKVCNVVIVSPVDGNYPILIQPGRKVSPEQCERFTQNLHGQHVWAAFFTRIAHYLGSVR